MAARDPETGQFRPSGAGGVGLDESLDDADDILVARVGNNYSQPGGASAGDQTSDELIQFQDDYRIMAMEVHLRVRGSTIDTSAPAAALAGGKVETAVTTSSTHAADGRGNYVLDVVEAGAIVGDGAGWAAQQGPMVVQRKYWIDPRTDADAPEELSAGTSLNVTSELLSVPVDDSIYFEYEVRFFVQEVGS